MLSRRAMLAGIAAAPVVGGGLYAAVRRPVLGRHVMAVVPGMPHTDGAGVKLRKLMGGPQLPMLDPFLMLDEFTTTVEDDVIRGFPEHPHRGFETVSILLAGAVAHRDSVGNAGDITGGGVQWMTAGRGIVHAEMPRLVDGRIQGYQLWVNLPAKLKMTAPRYQDVRPSDVPEVDVADARVRVLAGRIGRAEGPVSGIVTRPTLLDVTIPEGGVFEHREPWEHAAFAQIVDGAARFADDPNPVPAGSLAVLGPGDAVVARGPCRMLLFAGKPIGEPVARRGPFVMNTDAELQQAFADYRSGRLVGG